MRPKCFEKGFGQFQGYNFLSNHFLIHVCMRVCDGERFAIMNIHAFLHLHEIGDDIKTIYIAGKCLGPFSRQNYFDG